MNRIRRFWVTPLGMAAITVLGVLSAGPAARAEAQDLRTKPRKTGKEIYQAACSSCHGANGTGAPKSRIGFDVALPNFADCNFATRESTADWVAIAHEGGPVRGFSNLMPSFRNSSLPFATIEIHVCRQTPTP